MAGSRYGGKKKQKKKYNSGFVDVAIKCCLPSSIDHRISLVIGLTAVNPPPSVENTSSVSSSLASSVQFYIHKGKTNRVN